MSAAIEVTALRKSFGKKRGLVDLSLHVETGEIFGLVGPDGAGKTTALRMMAGLVDPDGGSVRLVGQDPFDSRTTVREALGYVPQQYSLYGDLSVAENLAFFREMYGLTPNAFRTRRDRLLSVTKLGEFKARRAEALSGGMYKKLALACALLHEPKVLGEFLADGMAIVIATPYMDEAARCHRVGLLDDGRLLREGAPDDMLRVFTHPVYAMRGDRDRVEAAIEHDDDVLAFTVAGDHLRVVVRRGHDERVLAKVKSAGAQVTPAVATFEDLFLASVREAAPPSIA
jgi:ABC-2 type transport system ATP-binding protein